MKIKMIEKLKKKTKFAIPYLVKPLFDLIPESLYNLALNRKWDEFNSIVTNYTSKKDDFFFIQIGSNDGKYDNPIHEYVIKFKWSGILVEPNINCFNKLVKN